jgi:hypothetical protein
MIFRKTKISCYELGIFCDVQSTKTIFCIMFNVAENFANQL